MTNSFRHGHPTYISIQILLDKGEIHISIWDNGIGAKGTLKMGIGLKGMSERFEQLGGSLQINDIKDGFSIIAYLPLNMAGEES